MMKEPMPVLRLLTCGSVDDGKSTLIGRLLYETRQVADDRLAALATESSMFGTTGDALDFALLVDGLNAEREQGITIDVAYRYFSTPWRKFIVADTPGHEQYTRNMATGASNCALAVILVDARKGLLPQTRRHSRIVHLLGIRHVVLAVNKMDAVSYDGDVYERIVVEYREFANRIGLAHVRPLPLSALRGDNLTVRSASMPWYDGPPLLDILETIDVSADPAADVGLRLPVQWVCRPNDSFRGYAGTVVAGTVAVGDPVVVLPAGQRSAIATLSGPAGPIADARVAEAVMVTLEQEIDIGRGSVLCAPDRPADVTDQFTAHVVWMGEAPMIPGRSYLLRLGSQSVPAQVTAIEHAVDIATSQPYAVERLVQNDIASCRLTTARPIVVEPYRRVRDLGGFLLIDRSTNETVCAGMIDDIRPQTRNLTWQSFRIDRRARHRMNGHRACCLWFTGLSGSGKSTIASRLEERLYARGLHTYILDGDNVRQGLNRDLGFSDTDRVENIRRVAEVAKLMVDAGLITIVSFISPFEAERRYARRLFEADVFLEVFVDTPIEECMRRDPKGLYARATSGEIRNFTGVSSPYEPPSAAECHLQTVGATPEALAEEIVGLLLRRELIPP